jgi:hypothetical protein
VKILLRTISEISSFVILQIAMSVSTSLPYMTLPSLIDSRHCSLIFLSLRISNGLTALFSRCFLRDWIRGSENYFTKLILQLVNSNVYYFIQYLLLSISIVSGIDNIIIIIYTIISSLLTFNISAFSNYFNSKSRFLLQIIPTITVGGIPIILTYIIMFFYSRDNSQEAIISFILISIITLNCVAKYYQNKKSIYHGE